MSRIARNLLVIMFLIALAYLSRAPRSVQAQQQGQSCTSQPCTDCSSSCGANDTTCRNNCKTSYNSCVNAGVTQCGRTAQTSCSPSGVISNSFNPQNGCCNYSCQQTVCGTPPAYPPNCYCNTSTGKFECQSPIIIDTTGKGFQLTDAADGVRFDLIGDGSQEQSAWPTAASMNAWLALDRNNNGIIDNGKELFGNQTDQPSQDPQVRNGFAALAVFDDPAKGGNDDGIIDAHDAIYPKLRLWIDSNHDGFSQAGELHTLPQLGVAAINLHYKSAHWTDSFGNDFRYKSTLINSAGYSNGRVAYDVFLKTKTP